MGAPPSTSPTGRHARSCWSRQAHSPKRATRTRSRSVSSATPPSAACYSSVSRRCRLDLLGRAAPLGWKFPSLPQPLLEVFLPTLRQFFHSQRPPHRAGSPPLPTSSLHIDV